MKVKVIIEDSGKPSRISEFRLVLLYAGLALKDTTQPFFCFWIAYLPPTKEEVHVFARVCLSV